MKKSCKVAIVHDYLHVFGGAEGVTQAIYELYPNADIYTSTYNKNVMKSANAFKGAKVYYPKWKDNIPGKIQNFTHKVLVANLPFYFYFLDLREYDLIISSTAHFAKGVRTNSNQLHISYIHTPPRFLYGLPGEIRKRNYWYWQILLWPLDSLLRIVDQRFATFPDYIVCNSMTVKERIKRIYKRDADVIHPFPAINKEEIIKNTKSKRYFLIVSRLAKYKNIDLAIKTCGENSIPLKVIGSGTSENELKKLALKYKSVEMLGFVDHKTKLRMFSECKAMLCTVQNEDFGMVALEANLFGKPVVALRDSGYLETVEENKTGIFFNSLTEDSLLEAINKLNSKNWDTKYIKSHANKFGKERFKKEFKSFIDKHLKHK